MMNLTLTNNNIGTVIKHRDEEVALFKVLPDYYLCISRDDIVYIDCGEELDIIKLNKISEEEGMAIAILEELVFNGKEEDIGMMFKNNAALIRYKKDICRRELGDQRIWR